MRDSVSKHKEDILSHVSAYTQLRKERLCIYRKIFGPRSQNQPGEETAFSSCSLWLGRTTQEHPTCRKELKQRPWRNTSQLALLYNPGPPTKSGVLHSGLGGPHINNQKMPTDLLIHQSDGTNISVEVTSFQVRKKLTSTWYTCIQTHTNTKRLQMETFVLYVSYHNLKIGVEEV